MNKRILIGFCALAMAVPLAAGLEFKPAAKVDLRGGWESRSPKDDWGYASSVFIVPGLKFGNTMLLPLMSSLVQGRDLVIEEDSFFVRRHSFLAKPMVKHALGDSWDLKAWGSAKRTVNYASHADQVWSRGLYDYEEFGGGLGADWKKPFSLLGRAGLDLERLHRGYPNWHELGVTNAKHYYSKDYDGWKLSLDAVGPKGAMAWAFTYDLQLKDYTDSYLLDDRKKDGTRDYQALRNDQLHRFGLDLGGAFLEAFAWGVNLAWDLNASGQGYFEFDPKWLKYNGNYYSYNAASLGLEFTWMPKGARGPSLTARASGLNRTYCGRQIRNPSGSWTEGKQADFEQRYGLEGRWPLPWGLAANLGVNYANVQSNQGYQVRLKNSYELFSAMAGLSWSL